MHFSIHCLIETYMKHYWLLPWFPFLDKGIHSFELLYLFTEEDINQMDELTVAGKKFIANEIAKHKESAV